MLDPNPPKAGFWPNTDVLPNAEDVFPNAEVVEAPNAGVELPKAGEDEAPKTELDPKGEED